MTLDGKGRSELDRRAAELAAGQHGLVARWQLILLGASAEAIGHRLELGRLHPVHVGVYAVGHSALDIRGRWMAAALACGPTALLSHTSAARLWRLVDLRSEAIHVSVITRSGRRRPGSWFTGRGRFRTRIGTSLTAFR